MWKWQQYLKCLGGFIDSYLINQLEAQSLIIRFKRQTIRILEKFYFFDLVKNHKATI